MAGLGESCSHIASLLWALEAGVRLRLNDCDTKKAYWVLPTSVKEVPYAPLSHINFLGTCRSGSLSTLKFLTHVLSLPRHPVHLLQLFLCLIHPHLYVNHLTLNHHPNHLPLHPSHHLALYLPPRHLTLLCHLARLNVKLRTFPPSSEELDQLFSSLSQCSTKPVILALVRGYSSLILCHSTCHLPCRTFTKLSI